MSRRNQGPRLRWFDKRSCYYVVWTERGRSRECSTGTPDREQAETFLAEWLQLRGRRNGPSDPAHLFVTDVLNDYARERGPKVAAENRIGYAVSALADFWEGRAVADVTPQTCGQYVENRLREEVRPKSKKKWRRSPGTARRELGVLRAAINYARSGRITRPVAVELPERPEARDRWLTRQEAGRIDFDLPGRKRTNKKRGKVRIPPRLLPHLRRLRKRGTDLGYVLHIDGMRIGEIQRGFAGACKRAGLEGVTPHTLRHTAATWLMQSKTDPWQASGFLAMSLPTLLKTYGHHHPDHMQEAAENIGRRPQNVRVIA
jgi:integrase